MRPANCDARQASRECAAGSYDRQHFLRPALRTGAENARIRARPRDARFQWPRPRARPRPPPRPPLAGSASELASLSASLLDADSLPEPAARSRADAEESNSEASDAPSSELHGAQSNHTDRYGGNITTDIQAGKKGWRPRARTHSRARACPWWGHRRGLDSWTE